MTRNRTNDYAALEREYVTGDMSVRELARMHDIKNPSLLHVQARRRDWYAKRDLYQSRSSDKAIDLLAKREADRQMREAEVRDEAIDAIHQAIQKMKSDMLAVDKTGEPVMRIYPKDLALLIDRLNVLFGRPSTINEERSFGITVGSRDVPTDLLREIADVARGRGSDARTVGSSALPSITDPRSH